MYHQLEDRIEAHIFTSFMALCLLTTLRALAREHAPGLTPRQIMEKMKTVKMVDVVMPTTDGRVVTLPRYVDPKEDVALLLGGPRPHAPGPAPSEDFRQRRTSKNGSVVKTYAPFPRKSGLFVRERGKSG